MLCLIRGIGVGSPLFFIRIYARLTHVGLFRMPELEGSYGWILCIPDYSSRTMFAHPDEQGR